MGINAEYMGSPLSAQAKATSIIASIASFSIRQKQQDVGRLKSRVWVERLGASRDPIATTTTTTTSSSKAKQQQQQQQHQKQAKTKQRSNCGNRIHCRGTCPLIYHVMNKVG